MIKSPEATASPSPPALQGEVAIIGIACSYPRARDLSEFWQNIVEKVDATGDVPPGRWDPDVFFDPDPTAEDRVYCKRGGYLGSTFAFNPLKYGTMPRAVEGAEPDQFLVLRTVHAAMADAGYLDRRIDGARAEFILGRGNYLGAGVTNLIQRGQITEQTLAIIRALHPDYPPGHIQRIRAELKATLPGFSSETAPGIIPNITTGRVANRLDLMGPNFTVDAACASSLIASELAVRDLLSGRFDLTLAGGVHIFTNVPFLMVFSALGALSRTSIVRAYDKNCDGTLPGEGVGIVVLKRLKDAERDGDRIYAVIKGIGTSSDGRAMSVTAPRVEGEVLAMQRAYEMSGVPPESISLIEGHGTGTLVGDHAEIEAMHRMFAPRKGKFRSCGVGSIKSMIGHAMPAAGAAGLIKAALALYHRVLPPTLNCQEPADRFQAPDSPFYVNTETRPWIQGGSHAPRRAGVSAFGFGGVNAHVVLEEYQGDDRKTRPTLIRKWDSEVCVVEGQTRQELAVAVARLKQYAERADTVPLRDIAYSLNTSLTGGSQRLAVVAESTADLAEKLDRASQRLNDPQCDQIKDSKGIYYFEKSLLDGGGKLAFIFPGEGAQYANMLADLCIHFPEVQASFEAAESAVLDRDRVPPSFDLFPPPMIPEAEAAASQERLWRIERATEAVLTADGAMYSLLEQLGVRPDMITGHSAGEWAAMPAAGMLDVEEFVASLPRLDEMYQRLAEDTSIPTKTMLAAGCARDRIIELAGEVDCTVHVANDNCPHQVVVVVEPDDADRVVEHLQKRGVFVERLPFDRGYHTPAFTYICDPLRRYFESLTISQPHTPLYCCTTAAPFPAERDRILDVVANTFVRPLVFRDTVEAMYNDGARIFVEVGPRNNLTSFVDDILRGRPHLGVATNAPRRSGIMAVNHAVALLAAHGVKINFDYLYRRRAPRKLTWDIDADRPVGEDDAPGTMHIPLGNPRLGIPTRPSEPASSPVASAGMASPAAPRDSVPFQTSPPAEAEHATEPQLISAAAPGSADQAMMEHLQVMKQFLDTQQSVLQAFLGAAPADAGTTWKQPVIEPPAIEAPRPAAAPMVPPPAEPEPVAAAPTAEAPPAAAEQPVPAHAAEAVSVAAPAPPPVEAPAAVEDTTEPVESDGGVTTQRLEEVLVEIVADKTGYPPEMLDLDLDMEADLGIDSIKRIEILGTLQKLSQSDSSAAEVDLEQVAKFKTLRQVVNFLEQSGLAAGEGATAETPDSMPAPSAPGPSPSPASAPTGAVPDAAKLAFRGEVVRFSPGDEVVVLRRIDLAEDLYINDHRFGPQLSESDPTLGALPVVPMTVSIEMMTEVATLLMPGLNVVGVRNVAASKWIDFEDEKAEVIVEITAKQVPDASEVRVAIRPHQPTGKVPPSGVTPVAEATVVFAASYPSAPAVQPLQLKNAHPFQHTAEELYTERRMFHGPSFQGISRLGSISADGLSAELRVLPMDKVLRSSTAPTFCVDPFLLDAAGQLVGYWPIEHLEEGFVVFPILLNELILYRPNLEPGARCACHLRIRDIQPRQLRADMDIIGPDGKLWMQVIGWTDWRFSWPKAFYDFWRFPNRGFVSRRIDVPLPDGNEDAECCGLETFGELASGIWENLWAHLIMSRRELAQYHSIAPAGRRTEWIFGRAAAKEAVRRWVKRHYDADLYPADVEITTDEQGKPVVTGRWAERFGGAPHVSISHKGARAVAVAGRRPLGIDLEKIEARDGSFEGTAFDERERGLLDQLNGVDRNEWVTRLWSAKEAAGKANGHGLDRGPGTMVVRSVDPTAGRLVVAGGSLPEDGPVSGRPGNGENEFVVHTVCDGGFVVAVAAGKRKNA